MTSRERIITAWNHKEPDRVPIELRISKEARAFPEAAEIIEFEETEADNFLSAPAFDWETGHSTRRGRRWVEITSSSSARKCACESVARHMAPDGPAWRRIP